MKLLLRLNELDHHADRMLDRVPVVGLLNRWFERNKKIFWTLLLVELVILTLLKLQGIL